MGCACLRGDGHHWPDRGAGRVAAGRRQQVQLAGQPGPALPAARFDHLRSRGDADAVRLGQSEDQPDADPNPDPDAVGQPIGDRDRQRFRDAMPIAVCDGITIAFCDGVPIAERQRETLGLALGPL